MDDIVEQLIVAGYTEQQLYEAGFGENPAEEVEISEG